MPPANISPELSRKYSSISTEGKTQVAWLLARNKQSLGLRKKIGLRPGLAEVQLQINVGEKNGIDVDLIFYTFALNL